MIDEARKLSAQLVAWRRHLHRNPELSGEERETAAFVAGALRDLGYEPRESIGGAHGLVADLVVDGRPPTLALRADMDALPIHEETGVDYASARPGVMHACGHDAHVAMLLGAAALLRGRAASLRRSVRLLFQPHEERYPGGAPGMIDGGALEGIERIFGIHICTELPFGRLGARIGPFMAAVNPFRATIRGRGGHAAAPERCVDPVVAASQAVMSLQTVVSRTVSLSEPVVVSVTQFHAGSADNVIPPAAALAGTIRTYDERIRAQVCQRVRSLLTAVAAAHGATAEVEIDNGYPVLCNDEAVTRTALAAAERIGIAPDAIETLRPQGGGEDFAYFAQRIPAAFVFLGAANPEKGCEFPHHHPRFNVDEDALPWGAALHAQMALDVVGEG